jgi:hypothetical protein
MRRDLARLRAAGLRRIRISALVTKVTRMSVVRLENIFTPTGEIDHMWIGSGDWKGGRIPREGDRIEALADIEPYCRRDGSQDLGLFSLEVLP